MDAERDKSWELGAWNGWRERVGVHSGQLQTCVAAWTGPPWLLSAEL